MQNLNQSNPTLWFVSSHPQACIILISCLFVKNLIFWVSKENQSSCWVPVAIIEWTKGVKRRAISRKGERVDVKSTRITGSPNLCAAPRFSERKNLQIRPDSISLPLSICVFVCLSLCLSLSLSVSLFLSHSLSLFLTSGPSWRQTPHGILTVFSRFVSMVRLMDYFLVKFKSFRWAYLKIVFCLLYLTETYNSWLFNDLDRILFGEAISLVTGIFQVQCNQVLSPSENSQVYNVIIWFWNFSFYHEL